MIIRSKKTLQDTVVLVGDWMNDESLTWKARGLIGFLISNPVFTIDDIINGSPAGGTAAYSVLNELLDAGYVMRVDQRKNGKIVAVRYVVFQYPVTPESYDIDKLHNHMRRCLGAVSEPKQLTREEQVRRDLKRSTKNKILKRDNYTCQYCGANGKINRKIKLHIDHIVPVSRGGDNSADNLQVLCHVCNIRKGDRLESELSS